MRNLPGNIKKYQAAFEMYLSGTAKQEIADKLSMPKSTLTAWIKADSWSNKKNEIRKTVLESASEDVNFIKAQFKRKVLVRQLEIAKQFDAQVQKHFESIADADGDITKLSPDTLKSLATVFHKVAKVSQPAVDLDTPAGNQKAPLVQIDLAPNN